MRKVLTVSALSGIIASCSTNETKSTSEDCSINEIQMSNQEEDRKSVLLQNLDKSFCID